MDVNIAPPSPLQKGKRNEKADESQRRNRPKTEETEKTRNTINSDRKDMRMRKNLRFLFVSRKAQKPMRNPNRRVFCPNCNVPKLEFWHIAVPKSTHPLWRHRRHRPTTTTTSFLAAYSSTILFRGLPWCNVVVL